MPAGVGIGERVVAHIAVAVEILRVGGVGDEAVGRHKAAQARIVPARAVVTQPKAARQRRLVILPGEAFGGERHLAAARAAKGCVVGVAAGGHHPRLRQHRTRRVQVVLQQVEDAVVAGVAGAAQRIARVVLGGRACAHHILVDTAQIERGDAAYRALNALAVGVIDKGRQAGGTLLDLGEVVLAIVDKGVGHTANRATTKRRSTFGM